MNLLDILGRIKMFDRFDTCRDCANRPARKVILNDQPESQQRDRIVCIFFTQSDMPADKVSILGSAACMTFPPRNQSLPGTARHHFKRRQQQPKHISYFPGRTYNGAFPARKDEKIARLLTVPVPLIQLNKL